tara:strand:+ start:388 stop:789 length:402 start_codon:yes stop_codon:yes gene_type:complete
MAKKWTEEEENFLLENMNEKVEVLAEQLSRSVGAVKSRIRKLTPTVPEPEMDDKKEAIEKLMEYADEVIVRVENAEELSESVESDATLGSDAIILDDIEVDMPVKVSEPTASRFTWVILLAAGLGLVLYGVYN